MPTLKDWFLPHEENAYHPHLLHTQRAVIYGGFFLALKAIVIVVVLLIPAEAFLIPDVLEEEAQALYGLTNSVRVEEGVSPFTKDARLVSSAQHKAEDMASGAYFSHTSPDGASLATWLQDVGYPYRVAGENLAIGYSDPRALLSAWIHSPSHFANLIDTDFRETGIGVAAGEYEGVPVVYVAQHFGTQKTGTDELNPTDTSATEEGESSDVLPPVVPMASTSSPATTTQTFGEVLGEKELGDKNRQNASEPLELEDPAHVAEADLEQVGEEETGDPTDAESVVDYERSFVSYQVAGDESLHITATVSITKPVKSAKVIVPRGSILLDREDAYGVLSGSIDIPESEASYFQAVLLPELYITFPDGTETKSYIRWDHIPQVGLTPIEAYTTSKPFVHSFSHLFGITNAIYFFFIGLFSVGLLIHIFWEIRVQRHHITIQTLCLLLLLITLVVL